MAEPALYGMLAEYPTPEALVDAAKQMRAAGYRRIEAYSPFPIEGLAELLGFRDRRVLKLGLIGGLSGAALAFAMQCFTNWDYPINVGGRPLYAVPAFLVVTYELMILFAVLVPVFGMLALNGLPRLHHPVFNASRFALASEDRFFLCLKSDDPKFAAGAALAALRGSGARHVEAVEE